MLARDFARALDSLTFARDCGIDPDDWQADLLSGGHRKVILNCARQVGKTTTTALLALHEAIYAPPALILVLSPAQRQSAEMLRTVTKFLHQLDGAPEIEAESALRLELRSGSRIVALPGSEGTVRCFAAPRAVLIDEASRVPDDLLAAVRPMLATSTNGRLIALSTPAGRRGWFHETWQHGADWHRIKITAEERPRISADFLAEERRELGELLYRQEYLGEFIDDGEAVFPSLLVEQALSAEVQPLWS